MKAAVVHGKVRPSTVKEIKGVDFLIVCRKEKKRVRVFTLSRDAENVLHNHHEGPDCFSWVKGQYSFHTGFWTFLFSRTAQEVLNLLEKIVAGGIELVKLDLESKTAV